MTNDDNRPITQLGNDALKDESPTDWYIRNVLELMEQFQSKKSLIESELDEALKAADSDTINVIRAEKQYDKSMSELQRTYTDRAKKLLDGWKERMEATEELN